MGALITRPVPTEGRPPALTDSISEHGHCAAFAIYFTSMLELRFGMRTKHPEEVAAKQVQHRRTPVQIIGEIRDDFRIRVRFRQSTNRATILCHVRDPVALSLLISNCGRYDSEILPVLGSRVSCELLYCFITNKVG